MPSYPLRLRPTHAGELVYSDAPPVSVVFGEFVWPA